MYPKLLQIGPVSIWSFGVMAALGFIVTSLLLHKELERLKINGNLGTWITVAAILGGILGAKIWWALEHLEIFLRDPLYVAFSGSGLVWYGGLIVATVSVTSVIFINKQPFLKIADVIGTLIPLGYSFGKLGCFLSGDGDYGPPSDLPWAMAFPKGFVPTPPGVTVHPTPLYEIALSLPVFFYLWKNRKKWIGTPGYLFGMYMILGGTTRFIVEFWRLTPMAPIGITLPQVASVLMIAGGIVLLKYSLSK